jgi:hypothetical protein
MNLFVIHLCVNYRFSKFISLYIPLAAKGVTRKCMAIAAAAGKLLQYRVKA